MQAPQERILGRRMVQKGDKVKNEADKYYYIPLLDSLQQFGRMELVRDHVSLALRLRIYSMYIHTLFILSNIHMLVHICTYVHMAHVSYHTHTIMYVHTYTCTQMTGIQTSYRL